MALAARTNRKEGCSLRVLVYTSKGTAIRERQKDVRAPAYLGLPIWRKWLLQKVDSVTFFFAKVPSLSQSESIGCVGFLGFVAVV